MHRRAGLLPLCLAVGLLAGCAASREALLADQYMAQGNWDTAVVLYREAVRKDPKDLELRRKLEEAKVKAAEVHYQRGLEALEERQVDPAIEALKEALTLVPGNELYREAMNRALDLKKARDLLDGGLKLIEAGRLLEARGQLERAVSLDPGLSSAREALKSVDEKIKRQAGEELDLALVSNEPITLKFRNTKLNEVFEFLSKATGINILFDKDVRPETVTVSIFIQDATFREALNVLLTTNNLFMKKINENTILIIPQTRQKLNQYQDLMIRTFYLSNTNAKDMVNLLRTMLETRRIFVNESLNALVMRDTPEKIRLAEKIIEANDRLMPEVMLEVEILEVNRTKSSKIGWNFSPSQIRAQLGTIPDTGEPGPQEFFSFALDDPTTVFFTLPSVIVDFLKQESDAETLANPRIRVADGKKAKINVGDRVPILLSTTTTSAAATGQVPTTSTATSVEFKDVGIKLDVEPKVNLSGEVTMKLTLEVTSLGDLVDLGNNVRQFRFGNRSAETVLTVGNGETVVIAGLIRDEDRTTLNKLPGLGDIPLLGRLFSNKETGKVKTDILLTIRPRVVRALEPPDRSLQSFWSGTEEDYTTEPIFSGFSSVGEISTPEAAPGGPAAPVPPTPVLPVIPPQTTPVPPQPLVPTPSTLRPDQRSGLPFNESQAISSLAVMPARAGFR